MATFSHDTLSTRIHNPERGRQGRPSFSSTKTSDRLHDSEQRTSMPKTKIKPQRRSVFKEEGLDDLDHSVHPSHSRAQSIQAIEKENSRDDNTTFDGILRTLEQKQDAERQKRGATWYSKIKASRPQIKSSATAPPGSFSSFPRVALIAFLIAVVVPGFRYSNGKDKVNISGADAGVILKHELVDNGKAIEGRQNSPTSICTRWSHMSKFQARRHVGVLKLTRNQLQM
jgi:hypothetical protein